MKLQPVSLNNRIPTLDILRGVSLFGILLVNIIAFYVPMPHVTNLSNWFTSAKDIINYQYIEIYVQSSFYPLFSMLFGYGIAMQFIKATEQRAKFYPFATKRLVILFIVGMAHAFLIWWGDILATYAFCGLFLLLFIRMRPGVLLGAAIILNSLFHGFYLGLLGLFGILHKEVEVQPVDIIQIQNSITAYGTGTWLDTFNQRLVDLSIQLSPLMWFLSLVIILPYMLIGAALAKWKLIERANQYKKVWITIAVLGVSVGLFIKNAPILFTRTYLLDYLQVYIGGPVLALGYIATIIVICSFIPKAIKLLMPFAKLGRMSLTMYLMQSIILSVLFYNWGFGLYGQVDVELGIYISVAIILVQIGIAELWFMKFKQGPIESIMKKLTYGKILSEK